MHALLQSNPAAGHHQPKSSLETAGHLQASPRQSLVGSLFLSPGLGPGAQGSVVHSWKVQ